ncbi:beta strand repeat-containing protein, partial [Acidisoma sp. 7E03]
MSGSISGNIFLDQNGDGSIGTGDTFLSGVVVTLYSYVPATKVYVPTQLTATTTASGSYSFSNLPAGTYAVGVAAPKGTAFSPVGSSASLTNTTIGTNGMSASPIVLGAATSVVNQDAGVYVPASFSGTVFADSNDDGLENNADTGLSGVTVQLLNGSGSVISTTTTGTDGSYTFSNLAPGTYSAHVVAPAGAAYSVKGSDATPQPTGGTATTTLGPNLITNGQFSTVGSSNFFAGWTTSTNTAGTPWGSGPGVGPELYSYASNKAEYGTPASYQTNTYAGTPTADTVSPYYATASKYAAFFVDDGAVETLSQTVNVVAGTTYELGFDLNETTPGQGNPGFFSLTASINGVPVVTAGSTSGTILTPGAWTHFADLYTATTTGAVTLTFTYQSGVPGSTLASKDVLVDDVYMAAGQYTTNLTPTSEVDPATGSTTPVTLASGQAVGNESAGIVYQPATITGTVFADGNNNGVEDTADAGAAGITVNLQNAGGTVIATTTTNAAGTYTFSNQAAGTYTVQVVAPSGDTFTTYGGSATSATTSTVLSNGTKSVTVGHGGTAVVNAGLYGTGTVSGVVFKDLNGDGANNGSDTAFPGQTVQLLSGSTVVKTTTTAANGSYSFTGVGAGTYTVSVAKASGYSFSSPGTSTTAANSGVNAAGSAAVTVTAGSSITVNAGEYAGSTVTGTVFNDLNADGSQGTGEGGLAGQTVRLLQGST